MYLEVGAVSSTDDDLNLVSQTAEIPTIFYSAKFTPTHTHTHTNIVQWNQFRMRWVVVSVCVRIYYVSPMSAFARKRKVYTKTARRHIKLALNPCTVPSGCLPPQTPDTLDVQHRVSQGAAGMASGDTVLSPYSHYWMSLDCETQSHILESVFRAKLNHFSLLRTKQQQQPPMRQRQWDHGGKIRKSCHATAAVYTYNNNNSS